MGITARLSADLLTSQLLGRSQHLFAGAERADLGGLPPSGTLVFCRTPASTDFPLMGSANPPLVHHSSSR